MSSIRHSTSFRSLRRGAVPPPLTHDQLKLVQNNAALPDTEPAPTSSSSSLFLLSAAELCAIHGHFHLLAEIGGTHSLAGALRTDITNGLHRDEWDPSSPNNNKFNNTNNNNNNNNNNNTNTSMSTSGSSESEFVPFSARRTLYGDNVYPVKPLKGWFAFAREIISDPMLIVLLIGGCVSVILGEIEDHEAGWYDGISIFSAVFLVVTIGATNSSLQEQAFAAMDKSGDVDHVTVIRGTEQMQVVPDDINVGDVVHLAAGSFIPADGVLLTHETIKVNESRMTGESTDVSKHFYSPFLFGGTEVREGQALMLVTAVGCRSVYGRILESLVEEDEETPLQQKLERAATIIGYIGLFVAIIMFIVYVIEWGVDVGRNGDASGQLTTLLRYFIICITIVVVAVPEGLPLAVTVSLAYSMSRMKDDKIVVRKLAACETMGNCTAICSDKTGTLTQNLMKVVRCALGGVIYEDRVPNSSEVSELLKTLLIEAVVVNSKAWVHAAQIDHSQPPETWPWSDGNQTEVSLLSWLVGHYKVGISEERERYPVDKSIPFDSRQKQSVVIIRSLIDNHHRRYVKGAAEKVLERCTHWIDTSPNNSNSSSSSSSSFSSSSKFGEAGAVKEMDAKQRSIFSSMIDRATKNGLRTIGFSYTVFVTPLARDDENQIIEPTAEEERAAGSPTVFIGAVGIADPLRPEARTAVLRCQQAGIIVRMVTGDHLDTASYIAKQCGIITDDHYHLAMTGEDFRRLVQNDRHEELSALVPRLRVLARSSPQDKETLVRLLQKHGDVVAATGDGTNDAPALHAADVGLAMYIAGTEVAKAAANVWILDDNFSSIVKAVEWGRCVYDNISKFVQFQLTINVVALGLSLVGAVSTYATPLGAVQLLWVNLIMDTFAALALGTELPTPVLLQRRPFTRTASLISRIMWRNILLTATYQLVVVCYLLFGINTIFPDIEVKSTHHYTIIFNAFVYMQLFNAINARKVNGEFNVYDKLFSNIMFVIIIGTSGAVQIILVEFGGSFIKCEPLSGAEWGISLAFGAATLIVGFFVRMWQLDNTGGQITLDPQTFKGASFNNEKSSSSSLASASSARPAALEMVTVAH